MHCEYQGQPEGPNPVANGGGYPLDGCFSFFGFFVILLLMAVEGTADGNRRPLRRRPYRPLDPERIAPLRCRPSGPCRRPVRSALRGFVLGAFAASVAVALVPLCGEMFSALGPPFSFPPLHGVALDYALTVMLVLSALLLALLVAPRLSLPAILRRRKQAVRRGGLTT